MERYGHALTLRFVEALAAIPLSSTDYQAAYAELTDALPKALLTDDLKEDERTFLEGYFTGMRIWRDTFAQL